MWRGTRTRPGMDEDNLYPHAWRYRDYVVQAFNEDTPFNDFIKQQLAGDLLPAKNAAERARNIVATGFLAIGPRASGAAGPACR